MEITDAGGDLKDKAVLIPEKTAGCVKPDTNEALQLYTLLYKVLSAVKA